MKALQKVSKVAPQQSLSVELLMMVPVVTVGVVVAMGTRACMDTGPCVRSGLGNNTKQRRWCGAANICQRGTPRLQTCQG